MPGTVKVEPSYSVRIWIAGDINEIRAVCRSFCWDEGLCVTVTATEFIYTGGYETGAVIGLINYPRFPMTPAEILETARNLAEAIRIQCHQWSYTLEAPDVTEWHSDRAEK